MNDTTRWLSPAEQHTWRAFVRLHQKLVATLSRDLQARSKLSNLDDQPARVQVAAAPSYSTT